MRCVMSTGCARKNRTTLWRAVVFVIVAIKIKLKDHVKAYRVSKKFPLCVRSQILCPPVVIICGRFKLAISVNIINRSNTITWRFLQVRFGLVRVRKQFKTTHSCDDSRFLADVNNVVAADCWTSIFFVVFFFFCICCHILLTNKVEYNVLRLNLV